MIFTLPTARQFGAEAHAQLGIKYGEHPYSYHLQMVEDVLREFGFDDDPVLLIAAHLHDIMEDTPMRIQVIIDVFGDEVAELVWRVTNIPADNREERAMLSYPKLRADPKAVALKLADRIANVRSARSDNPGLFRMYKKEHPGFRAALYRKEEYEPMWAELDRILA